jgi:leucyl-tRNA---protein transferase
MTSLQPPPLASVQFYLTAPYSCSYLPQQQARSQVAAPAFLMTGKRYSSLVQQGFRRSGTFTYRPHCDACQACVSARVAVAEFTPNRNQRRVWKQHEHLQVSLHELADKTEHFDLYQRYQRARHPDGGMDKDTHEQYQNFLLQSPVDTRLIEFRAKGVLQMVSIVDVLEDGLSAVYTFYEPDLPRSSLGTYNVLYQIELCRALNLPYLYLGYWIQHSRKMAYKANFQPLQGLVDAQWITLLPTPST